MKNTNRKSFIERMKSKLRQKNASALAIVVLTCTVIAIFTAGVIPMVTSTSSTVFETDLDRVQFLDEESALEFCKGILYDSIVNRGEMPQRFIAYKNADGKDGYTVEFFDTYPELAVYMDPDAVWDTYAKLPENYDDLSLEEKNKVDERIALAKQGKYITYDEDGNPVYQNVWFNEDPTDNLLDNEYYISTELPANHDNANCEFLFDTDGNKIESHTKVYGSDNLYWVSLSEFSTYLSNIETNGWTPSDPLRGFPSEELFDEKRVAAYCTFDRVIMGTAVDMYSVQITTWGENRLKYSLTCKIPTGANYIYPEGYHYYNALPISDFFVVDGGYAGNKLWNQSERTIGYPTIKLVADSNGNLEGSTLGDNLGDLTRYNPSFKDAKRISNASSLFGGSIDPEVLTLTFDVTIKYDGTIYQYTAVHPFLATEYAYNTDGSEKANPDGQYVWFSMREASGNIHFAVRINNSGEDKGAKNVYIFSTESNNYGKSIFYSKENYYISIVPSSQAYVINYKSKNIDGTDYYYYTDVVPSGNTSSETYEPDSKGRYYTYEGEGSDRKQVQIYPVNNPDYVKVGQSIVITLQDAVMLDDVEQLNGFTESLLAGSSGKNTSDYRVLFKYPVIQSLSDLDDAEKDQPITRDFTDENWGNTYAQSLSGKSLFKNSDITVKYNGTSQSGKNEGVKISYVYQSSAPTIEGSASKAKVTLYYNGSTTVPTNVGIYNITATAEPTAENTSKITVKGLQLGKLIITKATPSISAPTIEKLDSYHVQMTNGGSYESYNNDGRQVLFGLSKLSGSTWSEVKYMTFDAFKAAEYKFTDLDANSTYRFYVRVAGNLNYTDFETYTEDTTGRLVDKIGQQVSSIDNDSTSGVTESGRGTATITYTKTNTKSVYMLLMQSGSDYYALSNSSGNLTFQKIDTKSTDSGLKIYYEKDKLLTDYNGSLWYFEKQSDGTYAVVNVSLKQANTAECYLTGVAERKIGEWKTTKFQFNTLKDEQKRESKATASFSSGLLSLVFPTKHKYAGTTYTWKGQVGISGSNVTGTESTTYFYLINITDYDQILTQTQTMKGYEATTGIGSGSNYLIASGNNAVTHSLTSLAIETTIGANGYYTNALSYYSANSTWEIVQTSGGYQFKWGNKYLTTTMVPSTTDFYTLSMSLVKTTTAGATKTNFDLVDKNKKTTVGASKTNYDVVDKTEDCKNPATASDYDYRKDNPVKGTSTNYDWREKLNTTHTITEAEYNAAKLSDAEFSTYYYKQKESTRKLISEDTFNVHKTDPDFTSYFVKEKAGSATIIDEATYNAHKNDSDFSTYFKVIPDTSKVTEIKESAYIAGDAYYKKEAGTWVTTDEATYNAHKNDSDFSTYFKKTKVSTSKTKISESTYNSHKSDSDFSTYFVKEAGAWYTTDEATYNAHKSDSDFSTYFKKTKNESSKTSITESVYNSHKSDSDFTTYFKKEAGTWVTTDEATYNAHKNDSDFSTYFKKTKVSSSKTSITESVYNSHKSDSDFSTYFVKEAGTWYTTTATEYSNHSSQSDFSTYFKKEVDKTVKNKITERDYVAGNEYYTKETGTWYSSNYDEYNAHKNNSDFSTYFKKEVNKNVKNQIEESAYVANNEYYVKEAGAWRDSNESEYNAHKSNSDFSTYFKVYPDTSTYTDVAISEYKKGNSYYSYRQLTKSDCEDDDQGISTSESDFFKYYLPAITSSGAGDSYYEFSASDKKSYNKNSTTWNNEKEAYRKTYLSSLSTTEQENWLGKIFYKSGSKYYRYQTISITVWFQAIKYGSSYQRCDYYYQYGTTYSRRDYYYQYGTKYSRRDYYYQYGANYTRCDYYYQYGANYTRCDYYYQYGATYTRCDHYYQYAKQYQRWDAYYQYDATYHAYDCIYWLHKYSYYNYTYYNWTYYLYDLNEDANGNKILLKSKTHGSFDSKKNVTNGTLVCDASGNPYNYLDPMPVYGLAVSTDSTVWYYENNKLKNTKNGTVYLCSNGSGGFTVTTDSSKADTIKFYKLTSTIIYNDPAASWNAGSWNIVTTSPKYIVELLEKQTQTFNGYYFGQFGETITVNLENSFTYSGKTPSITGSLSTPSGVTLPYSNAKIALTFNGATTGANAGSYGVFADITVTFTGNGKTVKFTGIPVNNAQEIAVGGANTLVIQRRSPSDLKVSGLIKSFDATSMTFNAINTVTITSAYAADLDYFHYQVKTLKADGSNDKSYNLSGTSITGLLPNTKYKVYLCFEGNNNYSNYSRSNSKTTSDRFDLAKEAADYKKNNGDDSVFIGYEANLTYSSKITVCNAKYRKYLRDGDFTFYYIGEDGVAMDHYPQSEGAFHVYLAMGDSNPLYKMTYVESVCKAFKVYDDLGNPLPEEVVGLYLGDVQVTFKGFSISAPEIYFAGSGRTAEQIGIATQIADVLPTGENKITYTDKHGNNQTINKVWNVEIDENGETVTSMTPEALQAIDDALSCDQYCLSTGGANISLTADVIAFNSGINFKDPSGVDAGDIFIYRHSKVSNKYSRYVLVYFYQDVTFPSGCKYEGGVFYLIKEKTSLGSYWKDGKNTAQVFGTITTTSYNAATLYEGAITEAFLREYFPSINLDIVFATKDQVQLIISSETAKWTIGGYPTQPDYTIYDTQGLPLYKFRNYSVCMYLNHDLTDMRTILNNMSDGNSIEQHVYWFDGENGKEAVDDIILSIKRLSNHELQLNLQNKKYGTSLVETVDLDAVFEFTASRILMCWETTQGLSFTEYNQKYGKDVEFTPSFDVDGNFLIYSRYFEFEAKQKGAKPVLIVKKDDDASWKFNTLENDESLQYKNSKGESFSNIISNTLQIDFPQYTQIKYLSDQGIIYSRYDSAVYMFDKSTELLSHNVDKSGKVTNASMDTVKSYTTEYLQSQFKSIFEIKDTKTGYSKFNTAMVAERYMSIEAGKDSTATQRRLYFAVPSDYLKNNSSTNYEASFDIYANYLVFDNIDEIILTSYGVETDYILGNSFERQFTPRLLVAPLVSAYRSDQTDAYTKTFYPLKSFIYRVLNYIGFNVYTDANASASKVFDEDGFILIYIKSQLVVTHQYLELDTQLWTSTTQLPDYNNYDNTPGIYTNGSASKVAKIVEQYTIPAGFYQIAACEIIQGEEGDERVQLDFLQFAKNINDSVNASVSNSWVQFLLSREQAAQKEGKHYTQEDFNLEYLQASCKSDPLVGVIKYRTDPSYYPAMVDEKGNYTGTFIKTGILNNIGGKTSSASFEDGKTK